MNRKYEVLVYDQQTKKYRRDLIRAEDCYIAAKGALVFCVTNRGVVEDNNVTTQVYAPGVWLEVTERRADNA